ncbi:hypothetical protein MRX96_027624 [Rhipicephalus microplus]
MSAGWEYTLTGFWRLPRDAAGGVFVEPMPATRLMRCLRPAAFPNFAAAVRPRFLRQLLLASAARKGPLLSVRREEVHRLQRSLSEHRAVRARTTPHRVCSRLPGVRLLRQTVRARRSHGSVRQRGDQVRKVPGNRFPLYRGRSLPRMRRAVACAESRSRRQGNRRCSEYGGRREKHPGADAVQVCRPESHVQLLHQRFDREGGQSRTSVARCAEKVRRYALVGRCCCTKGCGNPGGPVRAASRAGVLIATCKFADICTGLDSLNEDQEELTKLSDTHSLGGYTFEIECEFTKEENNVYVAFILFLCDGEWDSCVEWPFKKRVTLIVVHPRNHSKDIRLPVTHGSPRCGEEA